MIPLHYRLFIKYLLRTDGIIHLNFSKDIWGKLNKREKKKFSDAIASRKEIYNFIEINDELFYSMGKVRIVYDEQNNRAFLVDYYIFYPICHRVYEHFHGCNCKNKNWNLYKLEFYFPKFLQKILEKLNLYIDFAVNNDKTSIFSSLLRFTFRKELKGHKIKNAIKLISILITDYKIEIYCSDWFAHKLGKSFWTVCEIPLEEIKL